MSTADDRKKTKHRSPAYPAIPLAQAIDKVRLIYKYEKRNAAPVGVVAQHCGTDIKNSTGLRLISALKQYGLVIEEGSNEDREVQLSERALDILLEPEESEKYLAAIRTAALAPPIHKKIWERYRGSLPSHPTLKSFLIRELDFNDLHVDRFIRTFFSTIQFSCVAVNDIANPEDDISDDEDADMEASETRGTPRSLPQERSLPTPTGPSQAGPYISFPLPGGNLIEIRLRSRVSKKDFERIKTLVDLSEESLVDEESRHPATQ